MSEEVQPQRRGRPKGFEVSHDTRVKLSVAAQRREARKRISALGETVTVNRVDLMMLANDLDSIVCEGNLRKELLDELGDYVVKICAWARSQGLQGALNELEHLGLIPWMD